MASMASGVSRRGFLTARPAAPSRPLPPGASLSSLRDCTGCAECVTACPENILMISDGRVAVDFGQGECSFCNACAEICPEPVFAAEALMEHEMVITDGCLARRGVTCMTCRDMCPEMAVRFIPRIGGPFLPELDRDICTGCGACVAPCPSEAITVRQKEPAHV